VEGRYLRTQGPLLDKDEYIPLEADCAINRYHFEVGCDEAGPWVIDLASRNGTFLNGVLLPHGKHRLRLDDQLQVRRCIGIVTGDVTIDSAWLAWNGGTIVQLAMTIMEERNFAFQPILADALEDAGCRIPDLLAHLREGAPHIHGCFVLDAVLGKES
jgi:hypothetical protein